MLVGFIYRGSTLSAPALFSERIDVMHFGLAASIAMSAGILGQLLGGRLADRFPLAWTYFAYQNVYRTHGCFLYVLLPQDSSG